MKAKPLLKAHLRIQVIANLAAGEFLLSIIYYIPLFLINIKTYVFTVGGQPYVPESSYEAEICYMSYFL